jgi:hypothetical protein
LKPAQVPAALPSDDILLLAGFCKTLPGLARRKIDAKLAGYIEKPSEQLGPGLGPRRGRGRSCPR